MFIVEAITPNQIILWEERGYLQEQKEKHNLLDSILCDCCGIKYTYKEYKIHFEIKKIAYFLFPHPENPAKVEILCHACLFKRIKKLSEGKDTQLLIIEEEKHKLCRFYAHDTTRSADELMDEENDDDDFF